MAYTAYTPDGTQLFSDQITAMSFGTSTGGSGAVTISAEAMSDPQFGLEDIAPENALADNGFPVASKITGSLRLQSIGESGGTTFFNELTNGTGTNKIAYFKVTYLTGQTIVIDSGTNDVPVMFAHGNSPFGSKDKAAALGITLSGTVAKSAITFT